MRTNLTGSATTARHACGDGLRTRCLLAAASLIIAGAAASVAYQPARSGEAPHSLFSTTVDPAKAVCHRVDDVKSTLFPKMEVAAYDFTGADAGKLHAALDDVAEHAAPPAALVRLVLVPANDEALAFQFGADGCHTVTLALNFGAMAGVFETAGVAAPFGKTFYQLPSMAI
jgi:hypothetical protein